MGNAVNIKQEIINGLDSLVSNGHINQRVVLNYASDPSEDPNVNDYPVAVLIPPSSTAETLVNRTRLDNFTYMVAFLMKIEKLGTFTDIEDLMDAAIDEFANRITLNGAADGGLLLSNGTTDILDDHNGILYFTLQLDAKAQRQLTF